MEKLGSSFDVDLISIYIDNECLVSDVSYKTGKYTCETADGVKFTCSDQ